MCKPKKPMCFSSSAVFKKAVILVYRENNKLKKKMVSVGSVALIFLYPTQIVSWVEKSKRISSAICPPLLSRHGQTNHRAALSHGDSDPFKFRWLVPLSALQVRLGNAAGEWHHL